MLPSFYWTLLALTCGYALWRGRSDERISAIVCLAASVVTAMVLSSTPLYQRYADVETSELIVDIAVSLAFILVAVRSDRFWPLWVAGLQLTSSTTHLLKLIDPDLLPYAYGAAARIWSYLILIILAVGTWRARRLDQQSSRELAAS